MSLQLFSRARTFHRVAPTIAAVLALTALPMGVSAQENPCTLRTVYVSVADGQDQPVRGLSATNFHATAGRETIPVVSAEPAPPKRILILLDQSGSMYEDSLYHTSAFIITNLVNRSGANVEFAFVTYANDFLVRRNLTSNHDEVVETVKQTLSDKSTVWGPSAMLDASKRGSEMFAPPKIGDVVLLVTDGGENKSVSTWTDVERRFAGSDVRLLAAVVTRVNAADYSAAGERKEISAFKKLIDAAGGEIFRLGANDSDSLPHQKDIRFHVALDYKNLPAVADGILREMASTYRLQISVPTGLKRPAEWKLGVASDATGIGSTLYVRYPPKIYPCSSTGTTK